MNRPSLMSKHRTVNFGIEKKTSYRDRNTYLVWSPDRSRLSGSRGAGPGRETTKEAMRPRSWDREEWTHRGSSGTTDGVGGDS